MRGILIGLIIIIIVFLIGDFIYAKKNTCLRGEPNHMGEVTKCGLIKKQFDINIHILDRYW